MPADIEFTLEGIDELIAKTGKLSSQIGPIARDVLNKAASNIEGKAKHLVPVDTGRLRASIATRLDSDSVPLWAEVGTNVLYARPVEYGSRPHYAPIDALRPWASKHGMAAGALWHSIWMYGTKPHPFMKPAFEWAKPELMGYDMLENARKQIEAIWEGGGFK
jgi:HK97 gp10 family phage protein